jgi:hypothetical protein
LGCGASFRPFAAREIVWRDDDTIPFAGPPPVNPNYWMSDQVDNVIFRQASQALLYERHREAVDVNALDEVPDSTWFTNRLSRSPMSLDDLRRGACAHAEPPPPPYVVIHGKETGTSPGALIRGSDGQTYLLKTDFWQPERGTAADVIGTRITYAAGYDTPCNLLALVREEDFQIAPDARRVSHSTEPYTPELLHTLLEAAGSGPDGTRRVSLSMYLPGRPLGGFDFEGLREADPNDVIPHQHRRELRGFYVLSAWMNHIDARAENNFDRWIETSPGHGYIQHTILDVGDSFGIRWDIDVDDAESRRFGNAHYFDIEQIVGDLLTLGIADRAYRDAVRGPAYPILGYYDVERFVPDQWRNGYPNASFERRTEADCAWMARIIAHFDEPSVRAIVETGRFSAELTTNELVRILMGRRERILERYLVRLSPLSAPSIEGDRLCLHDVAVEAGLRAEDTREYSARRFEGLPPRAVPGVLAVSRDASGVCVPLPAAGSAPYHVLDVFAGSAGREHSHPARVHLRETSPGTFTIVGLERPDSDDSL